MVQTLTAEQKIQQVLDIHDIHNVMGRHAYYHALGKHIEELDTIWVKKTPNPTFTQNWGSYHGYESIRYYYGEFLKISQQHDLNRLRQNFPEVEDKPENYGAGSTLMHTLTTPVIEVAGDGQTAKGVWYSPGQVTGLGPNGKPKAHWMWEKYAVDFAKEDGKWKIWHLLILTDLAVEVGKSWTDESLPPPAPGGIEMPKPDMEANIYNFYSLTQVPQDYPKLPEPYQTFSETFSY
jgi:hypothetical protein